ncbi:MAG TPA: Rieske 2Fe-2S domain-containing protein [Alphaproteobacteria bacterium]|nr:Rieske 2Fe-2S domain-containing protein [Alphaproteobacteria bacterium]
MSAPQQDAELYGETGLPASGLRNYWYPVLAAWRLRRRPKAVRLLGEDIVLYRDGGKVYALADRCAHRGAKLSYGKCLYAGSGTLSCPYHGWTFSGETGRCVAKLMEGPQAKIPDAAAVKSYPARVLAGVVWVFVGDMAAVPLEEDLPEYIAKTAEWSCISTWRTYRCNWTVMKDNLSHDQHAPFLHRTAPELLFQPIFPHASRNLAIPLEDGKGLGHVAEGGISSAEYPGLGRFPTRRESWFRILRPVGRGKEIDRDKSPAVVKYGIKFRQMSRLPSLSLIGRPSGDYFVCRWVVPVDAGTTLLYTFNLFRRRGPLAAIGDWLTWVLWLSWAHDWLFSEQDKWIVEAIKPGPEVLSRTDVGVVAWRRFAAANARRPQPAASRPPAVNDTAAE